MTLPSRLPQILTALALVLVVGLAIHWRPARQVRLHQEHLLQAIGDRNWKKVHTFVSSDYHDRWGQTGNTLLAHLPQVFGNFLACGVLQTPVSQAWPDGTCAVSSRIRIVGSGGPIAQFVIDQCQSLRAPFTFKWRHRSWKPWDWALIEVDQPELEIPADTEM